jgi:hypothetical protein
MERKELRQTLSKMKNKISELEKKRFKYFIAGKYIPSHGEVRIIEDEESLANAYAFVKKQFKNVSNDAEEIGIKIVKTDEALFLGYSLEEWKEEFKTRACELQNDSLIEQLTDSYEELSGFKSEDEKFQDALDKYNHLF